MGLYDTITMDGVTHIETGLYGNGELKVGAYPEVAGGKVRVVLEKLNIIKDAGYTMALDLDTSKYSGEPGYDIQLPYLQQFQTGVFVTMGDDGYVTLADGSEDSDVASTEIVVVPATSGQMWLNMPSLASAKLTVHVGQCFVKGFVQVVEEDIKVGDLLYLASGDHKGMLTKTSSGKQPIAKAVSANSSSNRAIDIMIVR